MNRLKVGLIGLGSVAQTVHLPVLAELGDRFETVAACDIDAEFAAKVGARHHVPHTYGSVEDMLKAHELDAVAIVNSDEFHCEAAEAALAAGCHVLLEKPVSLAPSEIERVARARDGAGRILMVGYMRRYAGAYTDLKAMMPPMETIEHVAMRDLIGPNAHFIDQVHDVLVPAGDLVAASAQRKHKAEALLHEAIGEVPAPLSAAYRLLCGLASHDFSALRGLIGKPKGVIAAALGKRAGFISVLLDYGDFNATYDVGMDRTGTFDASIEIFAGDHRYRIDYDTPYIRHLPTTLTVTSTDGEKTVAANSRASYRDPYTNQWLAFHDAVVNGTSVATPLEDAAEDIHLAIDIIRKLGS